MRNYNPTGDREEVVMEQVNKQCANGNAFWSRTEAYSNPPTGCGSKNTKKPKKSDFGQKPLF